MKVSNLRSPSEKVGGIVYFGRMLDKIRLKNSNALPEEYHANLGEGFDARCIRFLHANYAQLLERVVEGGTDEEILDWCMSRGRRPTEEEIEVWNEFMRKRGWNDEATEILDRRLAEIGGAKRPGLETIFDYIDLDEGRTHAPKG